MRVLAIAVVLALGLAACNRPPERPPMPKTGETTQGQASSPVTTDQRSAEQK